MLMHTCEQRRASAAAVSERKQEIVKLRNQWVPVDPRSWTERTDLSTSVGLGTGMKEQQAQMLIGLIGQAMQMGVANRQNAYQAMKRAFQALGYKNAEQFLSEPQQQPQQQPDPKVQLEQAKLQQSQQESQAKVGLDQQKAQMDAQMKKYQADLDAQVQVKRAEIQAQADIEVARMKQMTPYGPA